MNFKDIRLQSLEMHSMHSLAAAAALRKEAGELKKWKEDGHKAYLY